MLQNDGAIGTTSNHQLDAGVLALYVHFQFPLFLQERLKKDGSDFLSKNLAVIPETIDIEHKNPCMPFNFGVRTRTLCVNLVYL